MEVNSATGAMVVILCPRGEDEIREREGEYRHAEEESIGDPLHGIFGLTAIPSGAIHSRMMSRRSPCSFISPVP